MKKRIVSLLLVLILCLSSIQAIAYKREEGQVPVTGNEEPQAAYTQGDNIIPWASFDKKADIDFMTPLAPATIEWVKGGATGKGGALKVNAPAYKYAYVEIPIPLGETFDITFWAKADTPGTMSFIPMLSVAGDYDQPLWIANNPGFTTEWRQYKTTYTSDGKKSGGVEAAFSTILLFNTRHGSGSAPATYYLDELSIVPHGDVEYDWATWMKVNNTKGYVEGYEDPYFPAPKRETKVEFTDTEGHWAETTVELLASNAYVNGMGDGTYAPEKNVTRAEFMQMAMNIFRIEQSKYKGKFSDVKAGDWYADTIQTAYDVGLFAPTMLAGDKISPNKPITREEAAYALNKMAKIYDAKHKDGVNASFKDTAKISDWAKAAVENTVLCGLINGYPDGTFGPAKNITRAEAATMLFRVVELNGRLAVYVDGEKGDDANDGTQNSPLKTVEAARDMVRPLLAEMKNHIYVYINEGTYYLKDEIKFDEKDSGQNGYSVIYTSLTDEQPLFHGGTEYTGFTMHDASKNIYKINIGAGHLTRHAYINGVRAVKAYNQKSEANNLKNMEQDFQAGTFICDNTELLDIKKPKELEFVFIERWIDARARVETIEPTDDGRVKITMKQNEWAVVNNDQNCKAANPIWIENAYEFLNHGGEYYYDKDTGYLYYIPREFEDPKTMVLTIPELERGLTIAGSSSDKKIHNIKFNNLAFKYYDWFMLNRPETNGYKSGQNGTLSATQVPDVGDGRLKGYREDFAVVVADAAYVDFTNCSIGKVGGGAFAMREIFQNCNIIGNRFYDAAGTGALFGDPSIESDFKKYIKPVEYRYYKINNKIMNNLIHDVTYDYMGNGGVSMQHGLRETLFVHNEIYNTSYSGMHVGWGWNQYNTTGTGTYHLNIDKNYIHAYQCSFVNDGGAVYTLGATQPDAETGFVSNSASYNYYEGQRNGAGAIYPDNSSSYWDMSHNVVDFRGITRWPCEHAKNYVPHYVHCSNSDRPNCQFVGNYSTTSVGTMVVGQGSIYEPAEVYPDANWPAEAQKIVDEAGLESEYLAKAPDDIQRISLQEDNGTYMRYYLNSDDEPFQLEVTGYRRKMNTEVLNPKNVQFYSTDESVARVDEQGRVYAVGFGDCNIIAEYLDGDMIRSFYIDVTANDKVIGAQLNASNLNIVLGHSTTLVAEAKTAAGNLIPFASTSYESKDPSIATITNDGAITVHKVGNTTIFGTFVATDGTTFTQEVPLTVISYVQEDTEKFLETSRKIKAGDALLQPAGWQAGYSHGDGVRITGATNKPVYTSLLKDNEAISFDLTVHDTSGWPMIALRAAFADLNYTNSSQYLIGFGNASFELQRFDSGERTSIFGDAQWNPIGGPRRENKLPNGDKYYEPGKRFTMTIGTFDEGYATRIVMLINNYPIFDYYDRTDKRIPYYEKHYMGFYTNNGDFIVQPYTGIKFTDEQLGKK